MSQQDVVVGIDLGTTNSEIAAFYDGGVNVIGLRGATMLPSCVGLSPSGDLLVGESARNQQLLYPERTVRSIKRLMGENTMIQLGDRTFTPVEISACILRELVQWAEASLGAPVAKAVITVPAYFSDAQRQATREAGQIAGLEVVRILNEPTAASLAYGFGDEPKTVMVYDLGGGTFDVSLVAAEGNVTEVLASHGNNRLGGDDFDALLLEYLVGVFQNRHGIDLRHEHAIALARLARAAEEAKKQLSFEPYCTVREEALLVQNGAPIHFSLEISRAEYEDLITSLVDSTLDSVARTLDDAHKRPQDLDAVLLVGGSSRTPLISRRLEERIGLAPRQDVHPDLCVALGAGILASRLAGHDIDKILVDVSPFSFGTSFMGMRGGYPYVHCYKPIVQRNTPLPLTRTESYYTVVPYQKIVEVDVYQGEDEDALKNLPVGNFRIEGLATGEEPNEVLCRMSLDIDGILSVTAIEKKSGKYKGITINNALTPKTDAEISDARKRNEELFATRSWDRGDDRTDETVDFAIESPTPEEPSLALETVVETVEKEESLEAFEGDDRNSVRSLLARSNNLLTQMHPNDMEEALALQERINAALAAENDEEVGAMAEELRELLFFVETR
jgi:molecular chaperone DnaK